MICPNCGASNSTKATFCRRCHQRLPVAGLAAGVTYPRRRTVASGNNRLPIIAALALAIVGLVIGAMIVSFARPGGNNGPIAVVTPTPGSTLPTFAPEATPTPTPRPTPPPFETFAPLPTPLPSDTLGPGETPLDTVAPSIVPTETPTLGPPTPTPTAKPTAKPTPKPTPTPTAPPPTIEPILNCDSATGTPSNSVFVGTGNTDKTSRGWCLETATFRIVVGSMWGSADLLLNGKAIASYSCTAVGTACPDLTKQLSAIKLARPGTTISWQPTSCLDTLGNACPNDQFEVTIEVGYERATLR